MSRVQSSYFKLWSEGPEVRTETVRIETLETTQWVEETRTKKETFYSQTFSRTEYHDNIIRLPYFVLSESCDGPCVSTYNNIR